MRARTTKLCIRFHIWVLALLLVGCSTQVTHQPLSVEQAQRAVSVEYPKIAMRITDVEAVITYLREALNEAVWKGVFDMAAGLRVQKELRVADYYMSYGWVAMVEGDRKNSELATAEAEAAIERAVSLIQLNYHDKFGL